MFKPEQWKVMKPLRSPTVSPGVFVEVVLDFPVVNSEFLKAVLEESLVEFELCLVSSLVEFELC